MVDFLKAVGCPLFSVHWEVGQNTIYWPSKQILELGPSSPREKQKPQINCILRVAVIVDVKVNGVVVADIDVVL